MSLLVEVEPESLEAPGAAAAATILPAAPPLATLRGRALHLVNGEHYAGAERVQDLLALSLPELGYPVGLVALKQGKFAQARRCQATPLVTLPMRHRLDLRPLRSIVDLVRRNGYSLIHSHTPRTALLGALAARQAGVPLVHHLHSPASRDTSRPVQNFRNALLERWCLRQAARVITVSESLACYARQQGLAEHRLSVVPNGVPVLGPLSRRASPTAPWTLGTVALFRPRKGLEVLLAALAHLRDAGFPTRLRAVGNFETAEYEAEIHRQAERLNVVSLIDWVGFTQDVNAQLAKFDLLVLPSLYGEGLPMVVLEAMAAGVPVVATAVEGVPEAVRDGREGLLARPGDAVDLAGALRRIVSGQTSWEALRTAAHARQAAEFSDVSMAGGVAAVYDEVLAQARRP